MIRARNLKFYQCCLLALSSSAVAGELEFNRDIRPILSENCFHCHGPDEKTREAKLRRDTREGALKKEAIIPGSPEGSEVIYINTYAATTPRLPVFKGICSSAKDAGEDVLEPAEDSDSAEESPFSRELFRAMASPAKAH